MNTKNSSANGAARPRTMAPFAAFDLYPESERGRLDPTGWLVETPDVERGADLCEVPPEGWIA